MNRSLHRLAGPLRRPVAARLARRRSLDERRRWGPSPGWPDTRSTAAPILEAHDLKKSFDGVVAVDGVSLSIRRGEIHALIGPNDAGKTTLLNLLTGLIGPDEGRVLLEGEDVTGVTPWRLAKRGVGRSFQQACLFWALSPPDNVQLANAVATGATRSLLGSLATELREDARSLLARVGLRGLSGGLAAADLCHGDQRSLELATALAARPRLLLLDEPTAGLSPRETKDAVALIRRLVREEGLTLLFVEHDMEVVFGVADRITVLHHGRVIAEGGPREITDDPDVRRAYLGDLSVA